MLTYFAENIVTEGISTSTCFFLLSRTDLTLDNVEQIKKTDSPEDLQWLVYCKNEKEKKKLPTILSRLLEGYLFQLLHNQKPLGLFWLFWVIVMKV